MYDRCLEIPVDTGLQVFMLLLQILSEYKCTVCLGDILSTSQQVIHNSVLLFYCTFIPCNLIDFNFVSEVSLNRNNKDRET